MKNQMNQLLKQAQDMQNRMMDIQNKLNDAEITGSSGAGMVSVTLNGKGEMRKISIDASLMAADEKDVLEDLIVAAHNDAKNKVEAHAAKEMGAVTAGMALPPGFKMPF